MKKIKTNNSIYGTNKSKFLMLLMLIAVILLGSFLTVNYAIKNASAEETETEYTYVVPKIGDDLSGKTIYVDMAKYNAKIGVAEITYKINNEWQASIQIDYDLKAISVEDMTAGYSEITIDTINYNFVMPDYDFIVSSINGEIDCFTIAVPVIPEPEPTQNPVNELGGVLTGLSGGAMLLLVGCALLFSKIFK